jgi:hypothetical protein
MRTARIRATALAITAALAASSQSAPATAPVAKVLDIFTRLQAAQQKYQPVEFQLTDAEIDEYSRYALTVTPRPGLRSFSVKAFPNNYLATLALVDFDAVERWKPGTIPTLLKPVLSGQKTIQVDIRFQVADGRATFTIEKAYFQNIRLPAMVVSQMVATLAARQPEHYDTSKPVPLPFGLKKAWTSGHTVFGGN